MKRLLLATCALGFWAIPGFSQQGAPNEGQPQAGPSLKIDRDIEYARPGGQALKLDLYRRHAGCDAERGCRLDSRR